MNDKRIVRFDLKVYNMPSNDLFECLEVRLESSNKIGIRCSKNDLLESDEMCYLSEDDSNIFYKRFYNLHTESWDLEYDGGVLDNYQRWLAVITFSDESKKECHGINKFPILWEKFLLLKEWSLGKIKK